MNFEKRYENIYVQSSPISVANISSTFTLYDIEHYNTLFGFLGDSQVTMMSLYLILSFAAFAVAVPSPARISKCVKTQKIALYGSLS
jgi:hypothetical protein